MNTDIMQGPRKLGIMIRYILTRHRSGQHGACASYLHVFLVSNM